VVRKNLQEHLWFKHIFVLRAIHFSIGHFPFIGIFVLKMAFSPECWLSLFSPMLGTTINDQLQY
jgi:hypothetical protein